MYEFHSISHRDAANQRAVLPQNISLLEIGRLAAALAIIAMTVTLLDHAAATQVHSVVAANAASTIQWGN